MADEAVSHDVHTGYHPEHPDRLAASWGRGLGRPTPFYPQYRNTSTVVWMHTPNRLYAKMDRRTIGCFE